MALWSRVHTWVSNEVLTASDLNAEFDNNLTNSKATSVVGYSADSTEMQTVEDPYPGASVSLAASMKEELTRIRYLIKQMTGQSQWYVDPVGSLSNLGILTANINDLAVTTGKINDLAVTTGKIAAGAVTQAKRAALGQQVSGSSGGFTTSSTSYVSVTGLSVTITTTGRPVFLGIVPGGGSESELGADTGATNCSMSFKFERDGSEIGQIAFNAALANSTTGGYPWTLDIPAAGTYSYGVRVKCNGDTAAARATSLLLVAFEL